MTFFTLFKTSGRAPRISWKDSSRPTPLASAFKRLPVLLREMGILALEVLGGIRENSNGLLLRYLILESGSF